jgi:pimeloyl-ACP methyl ester carboxylesterase
MLVGLHAAIAARSTRGEARLVNGTGHYIQMDAPDAVVNGILDVLKELSEDAKAH